MTVPGVESAVRKWEPRVSRHRSGISFAPSCVTEMKVLGYEIVTAGDTLPERL